MIPVSHSQPTTAAIADLVRPRTGDVRAGRLERVFANHVYRIEAEDGVFYAKLARRGWRSVADATWEQQLLSHLGRHGIVVPEPVGSVLSVPCPEGDRPLSLARELAGSKPTMSVETYLALGEALARMHAASVSFAPTVPGRLLGASHLIRRPLDKAIPTLHARGFAPGRLLDIATTCADTLDRLTEELPFGVVHGDVTLDNVHIEGGRVSFFDFDLGGHGWFAYDLAHFHAWARQEPSLAGPFWLAMQEGYGRVRMLGSTEIETLPWFHLAYWIWDLEHVLHSYDAWFGRVEASNERIARALADIERHARDLGV